MAEASDDGIPHMESFNDVQGFPTIVHLIDGHLKDTYSGSHDEHELETWINEKIANSSKKRKMVGGGRRGTRKLRNTRNKKRSFKTGRSRRMKKSSVKHHVRFAKKSTHRKKRTKRRRLG